MDGNKELTREFAGIWIPADIWMHEGLTLVEKIVLMEINSLDRDEDGCYASNEYLSRFCNCSPGKVSHSISKLVSEGLIYIRKTDGRMRWIKSNIKFKLPNFEKSKSSTSKSNSSNNSNNSNGGDTYQVEKEQQEDIATIVGYLNKKCQTAYKSNTAKTSKLIKARLAEGFNVEDFKKVIDNKCGEWLKDPVMSKYLRPETLFGPKFESYLNTPIITTSEGVVTRNTNPRWPTLALSKEEWAEIQNNPKYFDPKGHPLGAQLLDAVNAKNEQLIASGFSAYNNGMGLKCIDKFLEKNPKPVYKEPKDDHSSNIRI